MAKHRKRKFRFREYFGFGGYDYEWDRNIQADKYINRRYQINQIKEKLKGLKFRLRTQPLDGEDVFKMSGEINQLSAELRELEQAKSSTGGFEKDWEDYEATGAWKGYNYYRAPTLDYSYVEKMANVFSAKYNVNVRVGDNWQIDLEEKLLIYNPLDLIFGTKAHLIASLLHEIGHLRHTTPYKELKSDYLTKYPGGASKVINAFEDFRIDNLMLSSYDGAKDVYEANKPKILADIESWLEKDKKIKEIIRRETAKAFSNAHVEGYNQSWIKWAKENGLDITKFTSGKYRKEVSGLNWDKLSLLEYLAVITFYGYNFPPEKMNELLKKDNLQERFDKTKSVTKEVIGLKDTQELVDLLDKKVFPVIEDLLKDYQEPQELAQATSASIARTFTEYARTLVEGVQANNSGNLNPETRQGGSGPGQIPDTWVNGNYDELFKSVKSQIDELVRKLTFLRRSELTTRYVNEQKRGKLNNKKLYSHATGNQRLFKKKLETQDTIRSFAFSMIIDTSGSMSGAPITHSTRGLIILAEVFEKMGIPFELINFGTTARIIKPFAGSFEKTEKSKLGGLPKTLEGSTNLNQALDISKIEEQPQNNKFVIVLSDGGVGNGTYETKKFKKWAENDIKTLGVGINCGDEIVKLCLDQGFAISNPADLPNKFAELLKDLIIKKKDE